jgi:hypothetical protein
VLSRDEQRAWDEIRRRHAEEAEEPAGPVLDPTLRRPRSAEPAGVPVAVVVASRVAVLLLLFGALSVGLAIAFATAFGWLLWRYRRLLGGAARSPAPSATRDVTFDREGQPSWEEPWHRRTPGTGGSLPGEDRRPR